MSNPYAAPNPDDLVPTSGTTPNAAPGGMVPPHHQQPVGGYGPPGAFPPPGSYPTPAGYVQPGSYPPPGQYPQPGLYPQPATYPGGRGYSPPAGAQPPHYGPVPYGTMPYGPYAPYQQPFNDAAKRSNWMGMLSLVLGICGLVFCFFPLIAIGAVVFGITGIVAARKGEATNQGVAIAGLSIGALGTIIGVLYWIGIVSSG